MRAWRWAAVAVLAAMAAAFGPQAAAATPGEAATRVVADNLFDVQFVGPDEGWITGYHGTVLHSADGGASWQHLSIAGGELLRRGAFPAPGVAWVVGHRGSIFFSDDAGRSWTRQHHEPGLYLRDIAMADARTAWVVGHEARILHTRDGGASWQAQPLADWTQRDLPRLSGVVAVDRDTAVAAGEFGVLAWTRDGGHSWHSLRVEGDPTFTAITESGGRFTAVGLDGVVVAAHFDDDGQLVAQRLPLDIPTHLLSVRATRDGLLASGFGVVVHCAAECRVMPTDPALPANYLWFGAAGLAQDGAVWAVGLGGTVARAETVNGVLAPAFVLGGPGSEAFVRRGDAS